MSAHILETATSTDIVIFQMGMNAAAMGLPFDPFNADPFWKAGHLAFTENLVARPIRSQMASAAVTSATAIPRNT